MVVFCDDNQVQPSRVEKNTEEQRKTNKKANLQFRCPSCWTQLSPFSFLSSSQLAIRDFRRFSNTCVCVLVKSHLPCAWLQFVITSFLPSRSNLLIQKTYPRSEKGEQKCPLKKTSGLKEQQTIHTVVCELLGA